MVMMMMMMMIKMITIGDGYGDDLVMMKQVYAKETKTTFMIHLY